MGGLPTEASIRKAMAECDGCDAQEFLDRYASGRPPRAYYLQDAGSMYPLKALWAASHRPAIHTRQFTTNEARAGFKVRGYSNFVTGEVAEQYQEGARYVSEVQMFSRNAKLVADAKARYGFICKVCKFDFVKKYGTLGEKYIECHHIDPLSGRDGKNEPTTLKDVAVLCANCHRMIHRRKPALTISELRAAIRTASF